MLPPGTPSGDETLAAALREVVGGGPAECFWHNVVEGLTFRLEDPIRYLKWAPAGSGMDVAAEAARLRWAAPRTPVPRLLATGSTPEGDWLLTAGLPGSSAVDVRWQHDGRRVARAIGTGLRRMHDDLPVDDCPFDWSVEARRPKAAAAGLARTGSVLPRLSTGSWSATGTPAPPTRCSTARARSWRTSTSTASGSRTAGRISPWRR